MHMCIYAHVYVYIYIYIYTYIHTHVYIYIYTYTYVYIYIYTHIHVIVLYYVISYHTSLQREAAGGAAHVQREHVGRLVRAAQVRLYHIIPLYNTV